MPDIIEVEFYYLKNNRGYGKLLLQKLEAIAENNGCCEVQLDASLGSYKYYENNGYLMIEYKMIKLPNDCKLCYFRMGNYLHPVGKYDTMAYIIGPQCLKEEIM